MDTRTFCDMTFTTSLDGTRTVRIPEPSALTDAAVVNDAAGRIVNANPFDQTIGQLIGLKRADVVSIQRIVLV